MRLITPAILIILPSFLQITLYGCSSSIKPVPGQSTTVPTKDSTKIIARSNSWNPEMKSGTWSYIIHDSSNVYINNDTTAEVRPINSISIYTISIADTARLLILSAHIDSIVITNQHSTKVLTDTSKSSALHTILSNRGHFSTSNETARTCAATNISILPRISELVIPLPPTQMNVGEKWTDTTTVTTCHGKIPLIETNIQEYELLDLTTCQQYDAITLHRTVSSSLSGSSVDRVNHLTASGTGIGSTTLCLQRNTGILLKSNGESRLDLTVTTIRGSFPFTQKTNTQVLLK